MFWRRTREAIGQLHPMHQMLIWQRVLYTAQDRDGWVSLTRSFASHPTVVKRAKWSLPPRTMDVLVPLIGVLCQDLAPGGVLGVTADLRGPQLPEKAGPVRQLPVRPPVRSATEWMVVDQWLRLRANLRDGSVLEIAVVDRIRNRRVTKRSRSGKIKTKPKAKGVQLIRVTRTLPRGVAGRRPAHPPPRWIRVKLRAGRRQALTAIGRLNGLPTGPEQVHHILAVVAEPFRWTPPAMRQGAA
jgi:hypothetical protein